MQKTSPQAMQRHGVQVGVAFLFWSGEIKKDPRQLQGTGPVRLYGLVRPLRLWRRDSGHRRLLLSSWHHRA